MSHRDPLPGIPATDAATCPLCQGEIHPGDRVARDLGRPAHCRCVLAAPAREGGGS